MNKLPVGEVIASSYRFLFGHIGTVLGITFLPAVLYAFADYGGHVYLAAHISELESADARGQALYVLAMGAGFVVAMFARAAAAVGIVREIFGWRVPAMLHFPLDRTALRMFAASIRFWLGSAALIALAFGVATLGALLAGVPPNASGEVSPTPASLIASVLSLAVFVYALATMLRMGFLLPGVVVAEEKGGLKRSHDLSQGNFWRMLFLAVVLALPPTVLLLAGEGAVLGSAVGADATESGDFFRLMARAEEAISRQLLPWEVFNSVVFILYSGLIYSGAAYAYRALSGKNTMETPAAAGH
ncbi:MAG TPA: hypothetical protein VEU06_10525 [Micropepsaceae bacterium]|nr:hypothetical protein [Micropepsaceae bacterium]